MSDRKARVSYKMQSVFKYPSEDECLVRRLGSAVLASWTALSPELQERILVEAVSAGANRRGSRECVGPRVRCCPSSTKAGKPHQALPGPLV
jgi:hypothetical protein